MCVGEKSIVERRCIRSPRIVGVAVFAVIFIAGCAASNDPIRQKNTEELRQLEACGYSPAAYDPYYPQNLRVAQDRLSRGECGAK
jgi:hypothetical protein